ALELFDLTGSVADNKIMYKINAAKSDTFNVLRTSGAYTRNGEEYILIMDEPFILNNTAWNIAPDNKITFNKKGINAQQVILSGEDQMVSLITQPGDDVPLKVAFENFKLSNISLIVEKDKPLARGELNGHFILFKINGVSAFTSDLSIDSLRVMDIPVGNIKMLADNSKNPQQFDVDFKLTGYDNDVKAGGYYLAHDSIGELNMKVDIPRLNMAAIEPFTFGQVSRMSGFLSGGLTVGGTTNQPDINGKLQFNDVAFVAPYANTYLKVGNNVLTVGNKRILFDNLTLVDTVNNKAVVNGYADFADFGNLRFDIRLNTENFLAMNSTKSQGNMPLYGKVLLDSDIHLTGTPSSPVVDMKVQLDNGTEVVYVMPETQYSLNESEGVVVFTDSLSYRKDILKTDSVEQSKATVEGITLNASITFEPEAILKMMVDPVAGDSMYVSGEGTLNFNLDPGGQMNLTGRYDINDGGYNITLNELIKRQFSLSKGSSITWTGDIMDAIVDLTAVYKVKTSPLILMEDQLAGADDSERGDYKNQLTFLVYLKMTGNLLKPDITFDIDQPENEKGAIGGTVNSKLNELKTDESQLNKQVFALLTLNRFLGQDPFETGNAPMTVESATRASASKILTQQFSALSEKYIKGVDLDVGVNSFEDRSSQEGRTQLQLGVSKELFNDRVTVQVGSNVELEGQRARQDQTNNIAGNINVEYKLTPNGRYRLRGFRRIEYENPIESELINTGIGFSYSRDFRNLRQIFWSEKKLAERRKQMQEKRLQKEQLKQQGKQNNNTDEKP
ncbi:MAG: translocation/assembly module TamB domain-containing protein, partial [Chloroflexota bacterium]